MKRILLNQNEIAIVPAINLVSKIQDIKSCKNKKWTEVKQYKNTYVYPLLLEAYELLRHRYKNIYFDVKVHNLKPNDVPCIPGWHTDGGFASPSEYVLYTLGSSHTEFNLNKLEQIFNNSMKDFCSELNKTLDAPTFEAKDNQFILYDNFVPHRGQASKEGGLRLLLRVMSSDQHIGETKDFQVGYYK